MGRKTPRLSLQVRRFIDAYTGSAKGNATEACRQAGYKGNAKVLGIQGVRLLGKASVRAVIDAREERRRQKGILDADARDELLSEIAQDDREDAFARISAVKELNKCTGRHSMTHLHKGKITLAQALAESRKQPRA